jgi:hypothetical protein
VAVRRRALDSTVRRSADIHSLVSVVLLIPFALGACGIEAESNQREPRSSDSAPTSAVTGTAGASRTSTVPPLAEEPSTVRIRLTIGDRSATLTLLDNATARDFASLLPVTLNIHDHLQREKAGSLPQALVSGSAQSTYRVGDVGYWSPSNDLAIYYDHDGQTIPSPGIVMIGTVDSGLEVIASPEDPVQLTIEAID